MRRHYLRLTLIIVPLLFIAYGTISAIRQYNKDQNAFNGAITIIVIGVSIWVLFFAAFGIYVLVRKKKNPLQRDEPEQKKEVEEEYAPREEPVVRERPAERPEERPVRRDYDYAPTQRYSNRSYYDSDDSYSSRGGSGYVSELGYGPVLEFNGDTIRDMDHNAYYRLENGRVYAQGRGLLYEISNNKIKTIYGDYLYAKSGDTINRVFGGYFASISGNTITKYDGSKRFQFSGRLSNEQILLAVVLLFGE